MLTTLRSRFSRNTPTILTDADDAPSCRFDVVEFGRILFSTDSQRDADVAVRFHYIGATVVDNG